MLEPKYEFTGETKKWNKITLHRIHALRAFGFVHKGQLGGWIEKESNLSHEGNCWVAQQAVVAEEAEVSDNAWISGAAVVRGEAEVSDNAWISGAAVVRGEARVSGKATVTDRAYVSGQARIRGSSRLLEDVVVEDLACVQGEVELDQCAYVGGYVTLEGGGKIKGHAHITSDRDVCWFSHVGSHDGTLVAYRAKEGIEITRGCFHGDLKHFIAAVKRTHKGTGYRKEYLQLAKFIKLRLGRIR